MHPHRLRLVTRHQVYTGLLGARDVEDGEIVRPRIQWLTNRYPLPGIEEQGNDYPLRRMAVGELRVLLCHANRSTRTTPSWHEASILNPLCLAVRRIPIIP